MNFVAIMGIVFSYNREYYERRQPDQPHLGVLPSRARQGAEDERSESSGVLLSERSERSKARGATGGSDPVSCRTK
jgi:hypothetical protein